MNKQDFMDILFYMWQLDIKTAGGLADLKRRYHIKKNQSLLNLLRRMYNSPYYDMVHKN